MGGSKTVVTQPKLTAQESELQKLSVDVAREQIAAIQRQTDLQAQQYQDILPILQSTLNFDQTRSLEQSALAREQFDLLKQATNQQIGLTQQQFDLSSEAAQRQRLLEDRAIALGEQQLAQGQAQFSEADRQALRQAGLTEQQIQFGLGQIQQAQSQATKQFGLLEQQAQGGSQNVALSNANLGLAQSAIEQSSELLPLQKQLALQELQSIQQGGQATPEQIQLIRQATDAALAAGSSDIDRAQRQSLEILRSELAPSLGLRPTDTPIQDRGARIAEEALRQKGQLAQQLEGQAAQAQLQYPLTVGQLQSQRTSALGNQLLAQQAGAEQASQFQQGLGTQNQQFAIQQLLAQQGLTGQQGLSLLGLGTSGSQFQQQQAANLGLALSGLGTSGSQFQQGLSTGAQQFFANLGQSGLAGTQQLSAQQGNFFAGLAQSSSQFQEQLRNQAIQNQLASAQTFGGLNLGIANSQFIGSRSLGAAGSTTTSRGSDIGSTLSGLGSLAAGGAALFALSDRRLKQDIDTLDDEEIRAAKRLIRMKPFRKFRYKFEVEQEGDHAKTHIGVMAQDIVEAFKLEGLNALDYGVVSHVSIPGQPPFYTVNYAMLLALLAAAMVETD